MPTDQPNIRIGDAQREQQVSVLGQHLTMSEFEDRIDSVYCATTQGQLDKVLVDLPHPAPANPRAR